MEAFKRDLREDITQILYDQTKRTPIVIPVVNEIGSTNSLAAKKAKAEIETRERDFEQQEMARIRGQGAAHFRSRKTPKAPHQTIRSNNQNTTKSRPSAPKKPDEISFKKTPVGPNPMRMWREY
jgi:hypothetical protein